MPARNLEVFLNDYFVGSLTQLLDGTTFLAFDKAYLEDRNRPTLSLSYKNVLHNVHNVAQRPSVGLPPFFSNLLPEGALRKYLAEKSGIKETQEYRLLLALKEDLPGAVILKTGMGFEFKDELGSAILSDANEPLKFSLAGVQLKFSGDLHNSKIVIPTSGVGGHWIVKFPSPAFPYLTELEYSMLLLASKIGIAVPEFHLVSSANIENLPSDIPEIFAGNCLISRRFDRTENGGRIHMEDFAQVFAIRDKYDLKYNYQSIANVLWIECGLEPVLELVRRLVHMIAIGNADMHLKNWSIIYPDSRHVEISPAYDLVSTIVYPGIDKRLPLKIAGIRQFEEINLETFKTFSTIAKLPERPILKTVSETTDKIKSIWPKLKNELDIPKSFIKTLDTHMRKLALFKNTTFLLYVVFSTLLLNSCSILADLAPVRNKVEEVHDWLVVPIFYATDRVRSDAGELDYIPQRRAKGLAFGIKNIAIPLPIPAISDMPITPEIIQRMGWHLIHYDKPVLSDQLPKIDTQSYKFPDGEISVKEVPVSFNQYRQSTKTDDVILFMHGCCATFQTSMLRAAKLSAAIQLPVAVYDWLSPVGFTNYLTNETYAEQTYDDFSSFLDNMAKFIPPSQIILLGHSMGAKFLDSALLRRSERAYGGHLPEKYKEIIFSQPDVDANAYINHNSRIVSQARKTIILLDQRDGRLSVSAIAHGGFVRLGRPGPFLNQLCTVKGQDIVDITASGIGHELPNNIIASIYRKGDVNLDGLHSVQKSPHLIVLEKNNQ